jgi:NADH-quinone oxidoreductase subunit K
MIPTAWILIFSSLLFAVGLYGVLSRKNAILVVMSVEVMLNAANVNFVAFSQMYGNMDGQTMVMFATAIAAAELAVGLAILLVLYKRRKTVFINELKMLRW